MFISNYYRENLAASASVTLRSNIEFSSRGIIKSTFRTVDIVDWQFLTVIMPWFPAFGFKTDYIDVR